MIKDFKQYDRVEIGFLRQRLFGLMWSTMTLTQSTIKILERLTLYRALPEAEDVASLTDNLHNAFNAYTFITRSQVWQDIDDNEPD